jgi:hypothetical protein
MNFTIYNEGVTMKKLFVVLTILMSFNAFASSDAGFSDANSAVDALLRPLMAGASGIAASVSALPGEKATGNSLINQAKQTNPVRPLESSLDGLLANGGRLQSYMKTSEKVSLGGKVVKQTYDLYFTVGPKKIANFVIMQPTLTGGFHIMDAQFSNAASSGPANTIGN